jgi:hypothetical protein
MSSKDEVLIDRKQFAVGFRAYESIGVAIANTLGMEMEMYWKRPCPTEPPDLSDPHNQLKWRPSVGDRVMVSRHHGGNWFGHIRAVDYSGKHALMEGAWFAEPAYLIEGVEDEPCRMWLFRTEFQKPAAEIFADKVRHVQAG